MTGPTFRDRLRDDLTDDRSVTVTAIGLAVATFVLASGIVPGIPVVFEPIFLLSLSLMDLSFVYGDHWPVEYTPAFAALWTLLFGAVTVVAFVTVYTLLRLQAGPTASSVVSFLLTVGLQVGGALLYRQTR